MNSDLQSACELKCDFCSTIPIFRSYDAAPIRFDIGPSVIHFLDTRWAACAVCATLIDEYRWDELTERSVVLWRQEMEQQGAHLSTRQLAATREQMTQLHQLFREARKTTA
jgi:hypothetical protein